MKMYQPEWRRYSSQDPEITQKAVRIWEDSDKTVLLARGRNWDCKWDFGDFTVGDRNAWVCDERITYRPRPQYFEVRTTQCVTLNNLYTC